MTTERLVEHYNRKYSSETTLASQETFGLKSAPKHRGEAVVKYLPRLFAGGDILELGAGNGQIARSLIAHGLSFASYTLVDISEPRIQSARGLIGDPRVRCLVFDIEDLSRAGELSGPFDAIIMVAIIEHLVDPISVMTKVRELLRPGGFAYIDTANVAKWTRRLRLLLGQFPSTASRDEGLVTYEGLPVDLHDEGHLHYFTFRSLEQMLIRRCKFVRVVRAPYWCELSLVGDRLEDWLARLWPEMFSELALIAYRD